METSKKKKVLIAIDYDKSAEVVAEAGFAMAKAMNAEITLLHVLYEQPNYYIESPAVYEFQIQHIANFKVSLQNFLNETKKRLGDESIDTIIKDGQIATTILETAKETEADIIVLGTHSRNWLDNLFVGNDARAVLKKTTIPLYIVPIKTENK
ncbi:universal stress protein [uncultured Bacteroides sp.]|uniref:universal stress protein n=1 Tax=uncultured Bacteroides sp. TaxID=162156 RepID=UPI002AAB1F08|nr:universal stress protein [uncultured Bacteroides sp.]